MASALATAPVVSSPETSAAPPARRKARSRLWHAPQDPETRRRALCCAPAAPAPPPALERCWGCFPELPPARSCDWLGKGQPGEADRPGQTLARFLRPGPHRSFPTRTRGRIYLLPLGDVGEAPPAEHLVDLIRAFFHLDAAVLPPPKGSQLAALERNEAGSSYGPQVETPSAASLLEELRPRDAFCVVGYTMEDICDTAKGFDFVFGQAYADTNSAVISFARYRDEGEGPGSPELLRRCGMVLCHEVTHLLGIKHCVYASCLMNGSNSFEEAESRPFALCPVDTWKLALTMDQARVGGKDTPPLDLAERQRALLEWFERHGLEGDAEMAGALLGTLRGGGEP